MTAPVYGSVPSDILIWIANNPEVAIKAIELGKSLVAGRSGVSELGKLKRSADAERARIVAVVTAHAKKGVPLK